MLIKFSPPLASEFGSNLEINLDKNITVRDLMKEIAKRLENFNSFIKIQGDDVMVHFMLTTKGRVLKMGDEVHDEDIIEVFLPVSGGR